MCNKNPELTILKVEKPNKRELIRKASREIIEEEGLDALSMNKVAARAKVAKGTLYLYFQDKEEIVGELTILARKELLSYFKTYSAAQDNPIDKIKSIFWANYNFFKNHHTYHELVSFYEKNTGLAEIGELAHSSQQINEFIQQLLENAKALGQIKATVDTKATTFIMWGMVTGILQVIETKEKYIADYTKKNAEEFFAHFIEHAVRGLQ